MVAFPSVSRLGWSSLLFLPILASTAWSSPGFAQTPDITELNTLPPSQVDTLLSISGGKRLMNEAANAATGQNYSLAVQKLQEARQVFNQVSRTHQKISSIYTGRDNEISVSQRLKAADAAQLRDESTYQLALIHRAQNQPDLAIPLLTQVLRSQQPTRDLGKQAAQQLTELGFIEPVKTTSSERSENSESSASPPQQSIEPVNTASSERSASAPPLRLSITNGKRLIEETANAVMTQNYEMAVRRLQEARQILNLVSNTHQEIAATYGGIDSRLSESQRNRAVDAAQLRDEATYQLALIHRAQNQPDLAIPLLTQVLESQQTSGELGRKASQQLTELGFIDSVNTVSPGNSSTSSRAGGR